MIYEDKDFMIEWEESEVPWIKIFVKEKYKEITDMPKTLRLKLWKLSETVETALREKFKPDKINLASFGNYVPQVHIHIMARFSTDSFFPEPMWGKIERKGTYIFKDEDKVDFEKYLIEKIENLV
ncbi:HIT family protein [Hydrogenimonas thermophila]|uniref:Diadenosine tetraphosphate (Ap4A) hydrolase n=1 Tax=Hydrogenimonas thermophila TaxID=223786 RepID=A0A1I5NFB1_9BACT|nr:HIT family protein [Hydrogenimonas thermophila]WOE69862.1 HIT family protein [Hydrogenimonas thermophila]WOE72377.1 HIT family protein [Hydrogenimonas thermophila]SFP20417.1 Diadenosine tetraphosphate (Ap4A) hydrolase [Hydrogenimonas thermophila]